MLSIIIPAYNEEKRIRETLQSYIDFFRIQKVKVKILVVINKTTDDTPKIAQEFSDKYDEIAFINLERGGKGYALTEGFKLALNTESESIGFVDADMATRPEDFFKLVKMLESNNNIDGVIAARWRKDSIIKNKNSIVRKLYSNIFNLLVRWLLFLDYSDTQCGAKVFKREAIEKVTPLLGIAQWAFDIDMLIKLKNNGFNIVETSTVWEDKAGSRLSNRAPIIMLISVIRLRLYYSPFRFIIWIYEKLPEKLKIHHQP
ncbi:glycosyltransferase [Patescibacteria group bacterium]|nr:glycosyltransferase [Patescibacteria group bacterium]